MPRRERRSVLERYRNPIPCEEPGCKYTAMIEIEGDTHTLRACVTHAPVLVAAQRALLRAVPRRCLACGTLHAETFNTNLSDYEASLYGPHLTALLNYDLDPKAYRRLAKDAGDPERVFHLHGDFYSRGGRALQPKEMSDRPDASPTDARDELDGTRPRASRRGR